MSTEWKWWQIAGLVLILGGLAYYLHTHGNPFKSKSGKSNSRGKVSTERGVSVEAVKKMMSDGKRFAVGVMSDDCGHCVNFKPDFFKAKRELGGGLKYLNATNVKDTSIFEKLNVRGFPTIVYVNNGKTVGEYSGNRKSSDVVAKVGKFLNGNEQ